MRQHVGRSLQPFVRLGFRNSSRYQRLKGIEKRKTGVKIENWALRAHIYNFQILFHIYGVAEAHSSPPGVLVRIFGAIVVANKNPSPAVDNLQ